METDNQITLVVPTIPERAEMLQRALRSVEAQTRYPNRLTVVEACPGEDAPAVKQRGLEQSETKWTAFLDDDDELAPTHLERLLETALYYQADLAYPWYELIDADGSVVDPQPELCGFLDPDTGKWRSGEGVGWGKVLRDWTLTPYAGNVIICGVLLRTEMAQQVGGFPQRGSSEWPEVPWEELGLWRRMLHVGAVFAHSPQRTYLWHRTHGKNTGGRPELRRQFY